MPVSVLQRSRVAYIGVGVLGCVWLAVVGCLPLLSHVVVGGSAALLATIATCDPI